MSATNRYVVRWAELEMDHCGQGRGSVEGRYLVLDKYTGDYLEGFACRTKEEAERMLREGGLQ